MSATISELPNHAVLDVGPGDQLAGTAVEGWVGAYTTSRDPQLRERIILAYLGLADRLTSRYRTSRGPTQRVTVIPQIHPARQEATRRTG